MISTLLTAVRRFTFSDWVIFFAAIAMAVGFYTLRSGHREAYYPFVKEDGPAETFQALCVLAASITGAALAYRLFRYGEKFLGVLFTGFALLTFVIFGEEISWGQRVFGWESNEYFAAVNMQKETNLHNDVRLKYIVHPTIILIGLFASFSPFLYERFRRRSQAFASFFTTEFPTVVYFLIFAGVYVIYEYLNPFIAPHYNGFDVILWQDLEMAETFFYAGVFGWTILKFRGAKAFFEAASKDSAPKRSVTAQGDVRLAASAAK